jgi:mono/diheme cytochrome c family protein
VVSRTVDEKVGLCLRGGDKEIRMKHAILGLCTLVVVAITMIPSASAGAFTASSGQQLFADNCAQCHSATSTETKVGPGLKGLFKNKTLPGTGKPTNVANVTAQIKNGGGGMPAFGDKLSAQDISALIAYLKTL